MNRLNGRDIARWLALCLINTVALFILPYLISSISIGSFGIALVAALCLGLINALIRPVLIFLTFPVTVVTLGLFILVINGLLFWLVASLVPGFHVEGFWSAMAGALLYSVISWALSTLLLRE